MCLPKLLERQSKVIICQGSLLSKTFYSGPSHFLVSSETPQVKHRLCSTTLHRGVQGHLQSTCSFSLCVVGDPLAPGRKVLTLAHCTHRITGICWGLLRARASLAQPHLCLFLQLAQPKQVSCCCVVLHLKASPSCELGALQVPCNLWEGGLYGGECHLLGHAPPITSED